MVLQRCSFRIHGGAHIGWAALPPEAVWEGNVGVSAGFSVETDIEVSAWVFVPEVQITATNINTVVVSTGRNEVVIKETKVLGSVKAEKAAPVNKALELTVAERVSGKQVKKVKITATKTVGAAQVKGEDGELRVFRPRVKKGEAGSPKDVDKVKAKRKTLEEKQEAERDGMNGRHEKESKNKPDDNGIKERHDKERRETEDRHKRERDDFDKQNGKPDPGKEDPNKGKDDPKRDPVKG